VSTLPAVRTPTNPAARVLPRPPLKAAVVIGSFTAVLYVVELVNLVILHGGLDRYGIVARTGSGLLGVLFAPVLHVSWQHLAANTIPLLVFGFLAMAGGIGQWIAVTATVWLLSGIGVWLLAPGGTVTIGASGIAFGWLAFLLVRGLFNRSFGQILIAVVLLVYWGGVLWGLVPGRPEISWQGHLFGALGGILAAWLVAVAGRRTVAGGPRPPGLPGEGAHTDLAGPGLPGNLSA
jgi:membrane associated rhomboid family serine protease